MAKAMIPISILGQPTKDDVAEGKRGREREREGKIHTEQTFFLCRKRCIEGGHYRSLSALVSLLAFLFPRLMTLVQRNSNSQRGKSSDLNSDEKLLLKNEDWVLRLKKGMRRRYYTR